MTSAGFLELVLVGEEDRSLVHRGAGGGPLYVSPAQVLLWPGAGVGPVGPPHDWGRPGLQQCVCGGRCSVSRPHLGVHPPETASPARLWCEHFMALKEWPRRSGLRRHNTGQRFIGPLLYARLHPTCLRGPLTAALGTRCSLCFASGGSQLWRVRRLATESPPGATCSPPPPQGLDLRITTSAPGSRRPLRVR